MNCPKCKRIMEIGCLNTGGNRLLWSRNRNRMSTVVEDYDVVLQRYLQTKSQTTAYLCRSCQTIIVEY